MESQMSDIIIDSDTVAELIEIMGDDMLMLIESFIKDSQFKITQLDTLNWHTEQDAIFRLAHSLKGASLNIGLVAFANYCELIERQARAHQLDDSELNHSKLSQLFEQAILALQQHISN
jgi:histidine phosphotransfer protein HptB